MAASDFTGAKKRRATLLKKIEELYKPHQESIVLFFAAFETDRTLFWQDSSFFYYTGITEAAVVLAIDFTDKASLYVPHCGDERGKWIYSPVVLNQQNASLLGLNEVLALGDRCKGYQLFPFFKEQYYSALIERLKNMIRKGGVLFTLYPDNEYASIEQRLVINHVSQFVPGLKEHIIDISALVASMRRAKDMQEIEHIRKAVEIAESAQEAAAFAIKPGVLECEVQASLEFVMTAAEGRPSFPSIVATGKNATILHYGANNAFLNEGELVVVDIGAVWRGYCSDLTRTYPVSGTFNKRQRELYQLVLDTQSYVADKAEPGMFLKNEKYPDISLHHLALRYLQKYGYDRYFIHGIGHFMGLDVHDVGDLSVPLSQNDVFTIEPGIYIPEENIGIRIEDDFWMAKKGCINLSDMLPKTVESIEQMVQQQFETEGEMEADFNEQEDEFMEH